MTITIGLHVFDQVEVLDFAGPFEVFTTASRVHRRTHDEDLFAVCTIARSTTPVRARAGLLVQPDATFDDHPPLDVLLVPGGVVTHELDQPDTLGWITRTAASVPLVASICTGAFLLAKAGVVNGKAVTTHWEDIDDLKAMFPGLDVRSGLRWVDEGTVVTSAGISAGIDMSLHLVRRLATAELAVRTARQMDFAWEDRGA